MHFNLNQISKVYLILLLSGIYWWYLAGLQTNNPIFSDSNLGVIFFRLTIGLPFIFIAGLINFKSGITTLSKPTTITVLIFLLILMMSIDILLRFIGFDNREPPIIHALYLGLRITIIFWIFGILNFETSHNQLLLIIIGYALLSIFLDIIGQIDAFQEVEFYSGYIEWLTRRYSGLSFNTNMFAGILLTIISLHALVSCHKDWKNLSAISLSILLIILAFATKGRFSLLICGVLGIVWVNILFNEKWSKIINWCGILFVYVFIILSVRISIFPISFEAPHLNTQPSFYRLAHEPNFKMVLSTKGIGISDFEQRNRYKQFVDQKLVNKSFEQINNDNQKLQQSKQYTAAHSIFLSLPLDYGIGALFVFLVMNGYMILRYIQLFGLSVETQLLVLTLVRYFHQQMSIASWTLLIFELMFLLKAQQNRSIENKKLIDKYLKHKH